MPKKKSKKGNTKDSRKRSGGSEVAAAAAASLPTTSPHIPPGKWLLPIAEVLETMEASGRVKDKLSAGQWILKSEKKHKTYYRYVLKDGRIQKQIVTHSCTSGSMADVHRAADLRRPEYTDDGGVKSVVSSVYVLAHSEIYPP